MKKKFSRQINETASDIYFNSDQPLNSRITSIHWNMIPWSIALTIDVPENESEESPHYFLYVIFEHVSTYSFPLISVNTLSGLFVDFFYSEIIDNQFSRYSFNVLRNNVGNYLSNTHARFEIIAINTRCFKSRHSIVPSSKSWLSFQEIQHLSSEQSFLKCYMQMEEM